MRRLWAGRERSVAKLPCPRGRISGRRVGEGDGLTDFDRASAVGEVGDETLSLTGPTARRVRIGRPARRGGVVRRSRALRSVRILGIGSANAAGSTRHRSTARPGHADRAGRAALGRAGRAGDTATSRAALTDDPDRGRETFVHTDRDAIAAEHTGARTRRIVEPHRAVVLDEFERPPDRQTQAIGTPHRGALGSVHDNDLAGAEYRQINQSPGYHGHPESARGAEGQRGTRSPTDVGNAYPADTVDDHDDLFADCGRAAGDDGAVRRERAAQTWSPDRHRAFEMMQARAVAVNHKGRAAGNHQARRLRRGR